MESRLSRQAKKDLQLYFNDFKIFWYNSLKFCKESDLIECYVNTLNFKNWKISLNSVGITHLDNILSEIHEDVNSSLFYSLFGQYRSAHMHMRSVIELSLQLLYFYQHEVEYEQWKNGEFRVKNEELVKYLKKHPYLSDLQSNNLIDIIGRDWTHYSKHIHAESPSFFQTSKISKRTRSFQRSDFEIWKSGFLKNGKSINLLMLLFFKNKLPNFPTQSKQILIRNLSVEELALLNISS